MFHAPMVDMAHTPEDIKEEAAETKAKGPFYPYGLCISLDDDSLEKCGLDGDLPSVGDVAHICCEVKVTAVSSNETEGIDGTKDQCSRVELQITSMGFAGANEIEKSEQASAMRKKRWYGGAGEPDGDETPVPG